ncbi:HaeIII family restriction endonuclease [Vibrio parahaemolyticus]|uniref:HaeIII family restriction endonuclease n=1 Tax=Vibrio parahaemolyticus TaxID=670 RepID=UPI0038924EBF
MISNRNGRALEFALVEAFVCIYPNSRLVGNTSNDQIRDKALFDLLSDDMKEYYRKNCYAFADWVSSNKVPKDNVVLIYRLTDQDAVKGDVTDIRLVSGEVTYNISLKHNHNAVKHQRPGNLFSQLGIVDKDGEKEYRDKIKDVSKDFYKTVSSFDTNQFSVIKSIDENIINNFYSNMCALVAYTINTQPVDINSTFRFLVGNCDFDKVIITKDSVHVMEFSGIAIPRYLKATQIAYNRVHLEFDNGFKFDMRLHTASSKFEIGKTISQKFDTQLIEHNINSFSI